MISKRKNEKMLLILVIIFFLLIIPLLLFVFLKNDFRIQSFADIVEINVNESFEYQSGNICYGSIWNCQDVTVNSDGNVNTKSLGDYYITYTYHYEDNTFVKKQVVKVLDKAEPKFEFGKGDIYTCSNNQIIESTVSAYDAYDGDLTDKIKKEILEDKIRFSVSDSSGNMAIVEKELKKDQEKPSLKLNGEERITLSLNETYNELGVIASDNCDGDLTDKVQVIGNVDTSTVGEYKLEYVVEDSVGNKASITRIVEVKNKTSIVTPTGSSIYLTFDDGPGPYTAKLLDILKKHNVKATFFVTNQGSASSYDKLILRAYQEGHTIGLHTQTHDYTYLYASIDNYFEDLYAIQAKVKRITGHTSTIIRFPGGSSNAISKKYDGGIKIMSQLTEMVEKKGFRYFDWNVSAGDANGATTKEKVIENIKSGLTSRKTNIVLQHDLKSYSVDAVEEIIKYGKEKGYTFRAITMSTPSVEHRLNN